MAPGDLVGNSSLGKELNEIYKYQFIETPFAIRFQGALNEARETKKWAIVGAPPRNGKTWSIKDLVENSGAVKEYRGITKVPILAIRSPESTSSTDITMSLCGCFGSVPHANNSARKKWLIDSIPRFNVEQIIIDDAHELDLKHLKFIKWLTDTLELEKNYYVSIVLSSICGSNGISVQTKIKQYRNEDWMNQLYERFHTFVSVQGLTPNEVAQVLYGYEQLYKPYLSKIKLVQYATEIFGWLTSPKIDVFTSGRATMEHLAKLIYESARIACIQYKFTHIPFDLLLYVYKVYLLGRDTIYSTENTPIYKPSGKKLKEDAV